MGTTSGGLPYPEPTDPVRDGALAIRELAEGVTEQLPLGAGMHIQSGQTIATTNAFGALTLFPPHPLVSGGPAIFVQDGDGSNTTFNHVVSRFGGPGASFDLFVWDRAGGNVIPNATVRINWMVIG